MFTIRPVPRAVMAGRTAREHTRTPRRLVSTDRCQSLASTCQASPVRDADARVVDQQIDRPELPAGRGEIIEHCRPHLAGYKLPRSVRFVPDLPKTSTGKVNRRQPRTLDP